MQENIENNSINIERIIDRFDKYIVYKGLNDNIVTKNLNLSVGTIGKSRKNGRDLSKSSIKKILNFYKDIDRVWFLTGIGNDPAKENQTLMIKSDDFEKRLCDMFKSGEIFSASVVNQKNELIHNLYKDIGRLEEKNKELLQELDQNQRRVSSA